MEVMELGSQLPWAESKKGGSGMGKVGSSWKSGEGRKMRKVVVGGGR